mmetsp:Transcript_42639/g.49886  ORF Transcript_42639/g.49886 Transcript_42639/m.49886 type:complete len:269 (+) Transcript_42639:4426-5232(+)
MALLNNSRSQPKDKSIKDFYTASSIQRERVPISCESNRVWRDILENRYIPFAILNSMIENKKRTQNDQGQDREVKRLYAFKRLHNYVWDKALIAKQSRKQNLLEISKRFMIDVEGLLKKSDEENLKGLSLHKEKYMLMGERLKLILYHFKNHVRLCLKDEELLKIRNQLLSRGLEISDPKQLDQMRKIENEVMSSQEQIEINRDKMYSDIWESDIYRLRGEIYFEAKHYNDANECFLKALELCSTSKKNWKSLAKSSEKFIELAVESK